MEDTNMATSSLHQQHQQFGQGLGNNGDGPPGDRQDDKSQRGHYADVIRPPDFMAVMKDAGMKHFHTRCMMCGETATSHHRKTWRECRGRCPLNPNHTHTQQICPDLLKVANEDWCIAHLEESMKAERDTARGPETLQRQEPQCEHRHEAPGRLPRLLRNSPMRLLRKVTGRLIGRQRHISTTEGRVPVSATALCIVLYLRQDMIIMVVILTIGILPMEIDTQNPLAEAAVGTPQITGTRNRNQAVQYSPSTHKTPARPHNVPATDPTDLLTDVDIDSTELPGMALIDVERYVDLARRIPTDGFLPLIKAGFDDERTSGSPLSGIMEDPEFATVWQSACDRFFCSMNEEVLIETIAGNIDLAYLKSQAAGTDVAQYIDKLRDRASYHPSCYVRPLTDTNGLAMSLDHYEQMLDIAERYCGRSVAHATEAYNIDCIADEEESQTAGSQDDPAWPLDDSRKERDDFWARKQQWVENNTDFTANVTAELLRRKALYKAEYIQQIAAEKKRSAQLKQRTAKAKSLFAQAEESLRLERKKGPLTAKNAQALEAVELGKAILKR
ncbi:unnamed protein product [Alternaria alternata]